MTRHPFIALALVGAACSGADKGFVVYNTPPAVTIAEPLEGQIFESGEPVYFAGQVVDDSDVTGLRVEWTSSLDNILPDADPPDPDGLVEFVSTALSAGTHVITLRAIDAQNEQGEANVTIQIGDAVVVPDDPTINIISPAPGIQGIDGQPFTFAANVDDGSDAPAALVVDLTSNQTGLVCLMVPDASGNATCEETLPLGQHLLTFTVTDSDENSTSANVVFEVVDRDDADLDGDGHTPNGGDCNDSSVVIYPGAPEVCDGLDNDCDPNTAIDVNSPCYDDDGDGYCEAPPCTNATNTIPDCDDADANVSPVGTEVQNLEDDDCDGQIDEGFPNYDDDGDGFCETPPCTNAGGGLQDCDDADGAVNPNAPEICGDGVDNNCNLLTNEQNAIGCQLFYMDSDGDGYGGPGNPACYCEAQYPHTGTSVNDCNDSNALVNPGQTSWFSSPSNGSFDYNCDGQQERRLTSTSAGCFVQGIGCSGTDGWIGQVPQCGGSGQYQDDCDLDIGSLLVGCGLPCALTDCLFSTGTACAQCLIYNCPASQVCDQGFGASIQECR